MEREGLTAAWRKQESSRATVFPHSDADGIFIQGIIIYACCWSNLAARNLIKWFKERKTVPVRTWQSLPLDVVWKLKQVDKPPRTPQSSPRRRLELMRAIDAIRADHRHQNPRRRPDMLHLCVHASVTRQATGSQEPGGAQAGSIAAAPQEICFSLDLERRQIVQLVIQQTQTLACPCRRLPRSFSCTAKLNN